MNNDIVNHPKHYTNGEIECIDAMESAFGKKELMDYCKIAAFKYIWRTEYKNGIEDIKKAIWYLNKYISLTGTKETKDEFGCYSDCKYYSNKYDEWCKNNCCCGLNCNDPNYEKTPYRYEKKS